MIRKHRTRRHHGYGVLDGPVVQGHTHFGGRRKRQTGGTTAIPIQSRIGMGRRRVVRRRVGGNIFHKALSHAHAFVKKEKLISKALGTFLLHNKAGVLSGLAKGAHSIAHSQGYGPRRRVRRKRGGSLMSMIKSIVPYIKEHKLISKSASHVSHHASHPHVKNIAKGVSAFAKHFGYGRRRHVRRGRGPGILTDHNTNAQFAGMGRKRVRRVRRGGSQWYEKPSTWMGAAAPLVTMIPGLGWIAGPSLAAGAAVSAASGNGRIGCGIIRTPVSVLHTVGMGRSHQVAHRHSVRPVSFQYPMIHSSYGRPHF